MPEDMEESNGYWRRQKYNLNPDVFDIMSRVHSLHVIENTYYDLMDVNRIDIIQMI